MTIQKGDTTIQKCDMSSIENQSINFWRTVKGAYIYVLPASFDDHIIKHNHNEFEKQNRNIFIWTFISTFTCGQ